ncbi:uncharacterized protein GIQ15_04616 [Arthroderma uncinatum]|uniref:uncharacterized protein n=1 Tax=Arthroderma uncinatum TaxID=74035 RepID=UPI00144A75E2|nr:uncharacterized protein GIQ15_04616 [Arthroderma uncinatum]KAF3481857.1 hypothetical protein GIQ15_04616 [Arthroderma uncinatum]
MARFTDLPVEILEPIFAHDFGYENPHPILATCARLNKRFYAVARRLLYGDTLHMGWSLGMRERLLTRTFSNNPELAALPRSVSIYAEFVDDEERDIFQSFLRSMPFLQKLRSSALHPTSVADLSVLKNLRELELDTIYIVGRDANAYPSGRRGLYTRLPPNIEKLRIIFPGQLRAFEPVPKFRNFEASLEPAETLRKPQAFKLENMRWLIEVAEAASTLSCLSHVYVQEDCKLAFLHDNPDKAIPLVPPGPLANAFRASGIDLELWIRDADL